MRCSHRLISARQLLYSHDGLCSSCLARKNLHIQAHSLHLCRTVSNTNYLHRAATASLPQSLQTSSCFRIDIRQQTTNGQSANPESSNAMPKLDGDKDDDRLITRLVPAPKDKYMQHACDKQLALPIIDSIELYLEFVNQDQENALLEQVEQQLKRRRYEDSHWDYAILQYREIEFKNWKPANQAVFDSIRQLAFSTSDVVPIPAVHILDLASNGVIQPHVDSLRFCGPIIAGLSLLSDAVMRFSSCNDHAVYVDVLLKRRSLYIMRDFSRYDCKHEIFGKNESKFNGQLVPRERRVSLLCRCEPLKEDRDRW